MEEKRNLGVTEARFALTLLTCFLVAVGYVALLRLGGAKDTSVEPIAIDIAPPKTYEHDPGHDPEQPLVVPIKPDDRAIDAKRPSMEPKRR